MEEKIPPLISNDVWNLEFGNLKGSCYLDQTGSALYSKSQVEAISKDLCENLYTNPHSNSLPSILCGNMVDQIRFRILQHFNTTANDYSVIFTSGATAALKIVAESFDFGGKYSLENANIRTDNSVEACGSFVYLQESHTSVIGMRNVNNIVQNGVQIKNLSRAEAFHLFDSKRGEKIIDAPENENMKPTLQGNSLFVFPAQCNFSGVKYPLTWIEGTHKGVLRTRHQSKVRCKWFCLLDAATYVSTNHLDLSCVQPDFVVLSFYKMWGLPTGLGALLVRNCSAYTLHKQYFGGGTIQVALASEPVQVFRTKLHERFEDGTINFLSICALRHGFDWYERIGLSMHAVSLFCFTLAHYTYNRLHSLRHWNGQAAVRIYSDTQYDDPNLQGGIVNFNILRDTGDVVGYFEVLTLANLHNIHLRVGCFCNPGACQRHLDMTEEQYYSNFKAGHVCGDDVDLINGQPTGSVRVSFGPYSRQEDADFLIMMISDCFLIKPFAIKVQDNLQELSSENIRSITTRENNLVECEELRKNTNSLEDMCVRNRGQASIVVSRICIYPIKSCGAFEAHRWLLDQQGLQYDRCWMIVTEAGIALTQNQDPRLCLIKPLIDLEQGRLSLTAKGYPSCSVPLDPPTCDLTEATLCQSKVCGDNVKGLDCGEPVAKWLSLVLGGIGMRLLRQRDVNNRATKSKDQEVTSFPLALSNQAQFLLVSENSVSWLTEKLSADSACSKMNMVDRFRGNFTVKGSCPAFEEQKWKEILIGSVKFIIEGPCSRCQMICIDQSTGEKTKEPLTTLAANCHGRIKFGIYLRYQNYIDGNYVSVGDAIVPIIS